jgi:hypothetical protein
MASMDGRGSTVDRVTIGAAGVIAAAGMAGAGRIAKEGDSPPFYFVKGDCSQFRKIAQDILCQLKSRPSIISW